MDLRHLTKSGIQQTIDYPDRVYTREDGAQKFIKKIGDKPYHVVAKLNPKNQEIVVISAWIRGEDDPVSGVWLLITAPFRLIRWLWRRHRQKKQTRGHSRCR